MRKRIPLIAVLIAIVLIATAVLVTYHGPAPQTPANNNPPPPYAAPPIVIGVEYAQSGWASAFASLGISGVKYLPASFTWDIMQPTNQSPINFAPMDTFVREYEDAGFTHLVVGLKSQSHWASVDYNSNPTPKPQYEGAFQKWVGSIVERYDGDGVADMPGLHAPVTYYEVGVEFSSYEPEPVADYIHMLSLAYSAAHASFNNVTILNAAFLATTAFDSDPAPAQYNASFAAVDSRIMYHSLADIRAVLDRPDIFDAIDFHALGAAQEIDPTVSWLDYEMQQRGYVKPIIIGDTAPSPLAGWGPATVCHLQPSQMAILIQPAQETDRCRLATFFTQLTQKNQTDLAWAYAYLASDMVEKVAIAAWKNVSLIDTSFMQDLPFLTSPLFRASGGLSAWGGMSETNPNGSLSFRPSFYALKQLVGHLGGYTAMSRLSASDPSVYVFQFLKNGVPVWMAWYQPQTGFSLPGSPSPTVSFHLLVNTSSAFVEPLIANIGQTQPAPVEVHATSGEISLTLGPIPCFVYA